MEKKKIKTPITYFGGKQHISSWIVSNFPKDYHKMTYTEPFCGGCAILFKKKRSIVESINDINDYIYCFFKTLRDDGNKLKNYLYNTLIHEKEYNLCFDDKKNKKELTEFEKACHFFIISKSSFASKFSSKGYGYSKVYNETKRGVYFNTLRRLNESMKRLRRVQIFSRDYKNIIETFNHENNFFYFDPPYPQTAQEYDHLFTMKCFNELTDILKNVKSKFMLSYYEKNGMIFDKNWNKKTINTTCSVNLKRNEDSKRVESIIMNY